MALKQHLATAQFDETSIERFLFMPVPTYFWIRLASPWMRVPICRAVGFPVRLEVVITDESHWVFKRPGGLDDEVREGLLLTLNP